MPAVLAADGGAARTRLALVASGVADIPEVRASGALEQVAAHGRLVAYLRARRVQQCLNDEGESLGYGRVDRHLRHSGGGTNPEALRLGFDMSIKQACETDQPVR